MDYLQQLERVNRLEDTISKIEKINEQLKFSVTLSIHNEQAKDEVYHVIKLVAVKSFFEGIIAHDDITKVDSAIVGALMMAEINDSDILDNLKMIVSRIKKDLRNSK